jgi:DDE superfamily endonuclease
MVFLDESGVGFTPPVRRTWAPRGRTPILRHRQRHWSRLSIAGMCCYRPDGARARLAVHLQPGSYNDQVLIGVLGQLRRLLGGQKATLLWDGLPSHPSRVMQAFIASQHGWLVVERLPGYAPELNPVEGLWANLKDQEFANYAADTLQDSRTLRRRPVMASGASGDGHGCCLRSLTAPGFHYDHMSPYSEKLFRWPPRCR